ncbi:uncharacterized protein LOC115374547 [Myripristis murdjan]|uniref:uncharacterized protein LOC115374547 n=1 Tax=Myripristis murdjan TaxID=586833 RepID=UPI001175EA57|nr:uncharacterized protein LOC115374547 [Myripristis murdjan]
MAVWDKKTPCCFVMILAGVLGQSVNYPNPICAVKGSTVTIPCTFTPRALFQDKGKTVLLQVVRVVWCQNHLICHRETPSVYDSNVTRTSTHFRYLGDKKGICTLQIENIQMQDTKTYRFRMEADNIEGHFTGTRGVNITVIEGSKMRISGPSGERVVKSGDEVTFTCTAFCSFHRLGLAWYRDEHRLLEEGSALRLSALTAADSGNYSCALKDKASTRSEPYSLHVQDDEVQSVNLPLVAGVGVGVLLALLTLIIVVFIIVIRRRRAAAAEKPQMDDVAVQKPQENTYSNILERQEVSSAAEEVNYASVHFKHNGASSRPEYDDCSQTEEAVIYTSVARLQ